MQKLNKSYFVTATVSTPHNNNKEKIYISTEDLKAAFEVEHELLNYKTMEIFNIRKSKTKPKSSKNYIEISQINDIENLG